MENRFLYEIRPVRPIMINGRMTRVACSMNLTKEEAAEYMKSANLYRRFGAGTLIKVTGANLDLVHTSKDDALSSGLITIGSGELNLGIIKSDDTDSKDHIEKEIDREEEKKLDKEYQHNPEEEVKEESVEEEKAENIKETPVDTQDTMTEAQIPNAVDATEPKTDAPVATTNTVIVNNSNHSNNNYQNYKKNKNNNNRNHR